MGLSRQPPLSGCCSGGCGSLWRSSVLGFQEGCPHPSSHFLFFPLFAFPVAFPFFPASQVNEKKVREQNTGKFLLLILP